MESSPKTDPLVLLDNLRQDCESLHGLKFGKTLTTLKTDEIERLIPMIAVIGDQSSGKSTVLSRLCGIELSSGEGKVSSFPVEIRFRNKPDERASFRLVDAGGSTLEEGDFDSGVAKRLQDQENEANDKFSTKKLILTLEGPDRKNYTIIDLPGMIAVNDQYTSGDVEQVEKMAVARLQHQNCLALHVSALEKDQGTVISHKVLTTAKKPDAMVINVFTKIDRCTNLAGFFDSLKGDRLNIAVCNGEFDAESTFVRFDNSAEKRYFARKNYGQGRPIEFGIACLEETLFRVLQDFVKKSLPEIKKLCDPLSRDLQLRLLELGRTKPDPTSLRDHFREIVLRRRKELFEESETQDGTKTFRFRVKEHNRKIVECLPRDWPSAGVLLTAATIRTFQQSHLGDTVGPFGDNMPTLRHFLKLAVNYISKGFEAWLQGLYDVYDELVTGLSQGSHVPNNLKEVACDLEELRPKIIQGIGSEICKSRVDLEEVYLRPFLVDESACTKAGIPQNSTKEEELQRWIESFWSRKMEEIRITVVNRFRVFEIDVHRLISQEVDSHKWSSKLFEENSEFQLLRETYLRLEGGLRQIGVLRD